MVPGPIKRRSRKLEDLRDEGSGHNCWKAYINMLTVVLEEIIPFCDFREIPILSKGGKACKAAETWHSWHLGVHDEMKVHTQLRRI